MSSSRDPLASACDSSPDWPSPGLIREVLAEAMMAGQFFVSKAVSLEWNHEQEEVFWEIFRGRSLDRAQTRQRRRFESWNLREINPAILDDEPMLSVKYDVDVGEVHVTRSILCYAWEAYADEEGAIQSRETVKRNRELVGSLQLSEYHAREDFLKDIGDLLFLAVVGTSRLPLTSEEAPHPAFTFGQWMYCYRPNAGDRPSANISEWIANSLPPELVWREIARLLEFVTRASPKDAIDAVSRNWLLRWSAVGHGPKDLLSLFRIVFEEISLSPYTDFVPKFICFLKSLVKQGYISPADETDVLTYQLRLLCRHLNAFDLVRFHHRGANYPDALLLDELLWRLFVVAEAMPNLFLSQGGDSIADEKKKQLRRRALRLGWLARCQYVGLAVPEFPTSPGENNRVLPPPYGRLTEEEIINP